MNTNTAANTVHIANGPTCGCCNTATIPPTPGTDEVGFYCEGCGTAWETAEGTRTMRPHSCLLHRG